jgi:hypothetical protein
MFLQLNFRRGLFYSKMPNSLWTNQFGCALAHQRDQKMYKNKKFLEFNLREGYLKPKLKNGGPLGPKGGLRSKKLIIGGVYCM